MMTKIWAGLAVCAVVCGAVSGRLSEVSAAAASGARGAVDFLISVTGVMCFWSGMMEIMSSSGLSERIARAVRPVIRPLFGRIAEDAEAAEYIAANITANLLGLANAATPVGLRAAARIHELEGKGETAGRGLVTLVVLNTASLQLLPTTVAAVRAGLGSPAPYAIIPAVWAASALSVTAGLAAVRLTAGGVNG